MAIEASNVRSPSPLPPLDNHAQPEVETLIVNQGTLLTPIRSSSPTPVSPTSRPTAQARYAKFRRHYPSWSAPTRSRGRFANASGSIRTWSRSSTWTSTASGWSALPTAAHDSITWMGARLHPRRDCSDAKMLPKLSAMSRGRTSGMSTFPGETC
ncbi:hypothetical protein VTK56DRAFT_9506 [Thermocarpiscus australiensis]